MDYYTDDRYALKFESSPKSVGSWQIGPYVNISMTKRPNWLHRTMARLLLGWEWVDSDCA